MTKMRNAEMQRLFRCTPEELSELKQTFQREMQNTQANGKPILGRLADEADESGELRESMWQAVADTKEAFADMLSGVRWGDRRPADFDMQLRQALNKIWRDFNRPARDLINSGKGRRGASPDDSAPRGRVDEDARRASKRLQGRAVSGSPGTPIVLLDDPQEGPAPRDNDSESDCRPHWQPPRPCARADQSVVRFPVSNAGYIVKNGNVVRNEPSAPDIFMSGNDRARTLGLANADATPEVRDPHDAQSGTPVHFNQDREGQTRLATTEPAVQRPNLTTRIKEAVETGVADLRTKVEGLEQNVVSETQLTSKVEAVEERIMGKMEAMLAQRDADIGALKAQLDAERAWRFS